jgi:hypothetical protein
MDDFDRAAEFEELRRQLALGFRKPAGPPATGHCVFCGEAVAQGVRWCNRDCREDWEREARARKEATCRS